MSQPCYGKVLSYDPREQAFYVEGRKDKIDLTVDDFKSLGIKDPEELVGCVVDWAYDHPYLTIAMGVRVLERKP